MSSLLAQSTCNPELQECPRPSTSVLRFPAAIRNALLLAWEMPDLSVSERHVLVTIIKCGVDKIHPLTPVYPRKATIADLTGLSEPTVMRALSALERRNLIIRHEQTRTTFGELGLSAIALTPYCASLLALFPPTSVANPHVSSITTASPHHQSATTAPPPNAELPQHTSPSLKPEATGIPADHPSESSPKDPFAASRPPAQAAHLSPTIDGHMYTDKEQSLQKQSFREPFVPIGATRLPPDLVFLHTKHGLSGPAVLALMRLAKVAGSLLSDVVAVVGLQIAHLRGRQLFGYLHRIISQRKDWSHLRQTSERVRMERETAKARKQELAESIRSLTGKWFERPDGTRCYGVDKTLIHCFERDTSGWIEIGSRPITTDFVELVRAGSLLPSSPVMRSAVRRPAEIGRRRAFAGGTASLRNILSGAGHFQAA